MTKLQLEHLFDISCLPHATSPEIDIGTREVRLVIGVLAAVFFTTVTVLLRFNRQVETRSSLLVRGLANIRCLGMFSPNRLSYSDAHFVQWILAAGPL